MSTIPASTIVSVNPGVLAAGGTALDLIAAIMTTSTRVPIGTVQKFASATDVADYFGPSSHEASIANVYFGGFSTSTKKPGAVLFAQYNTASVAAYLRGGDVSSMTLTELQALSGETLAVTIDGVLKSAAINNLNTATSFSNAAQLIGNDLGIHGVQVGAVTASMAGTVMTVTAVGSGALAVGDVVTGSGVTAGTYITSLGTGTGGTGTYNISASQTVGSEAMTIYGPGVTYDSVSGAFEVFSGTAGGSSTITFGSNTLATSLLLTQAGGAVLSQGATAATPAAFMDALVALTQDWATFMLGFDPDAGSGNAQKLLFSAWNNAQNNRYAFVCWDTDASPTNTVPATSSLGYLIAQANYSGTCLIYEPGDLYDAAFVCGYVASLDFDATNGRTTIAGRSQDGLTAGVTNQSVSENLIANGYNFYGAYATANEQFVFFYPGSISGPFQWLDSYVNQIWMNNNFQLSLMILFTTINSIPFNAAGDAIIEAALADDINAALNFGAIRPGVELSSSQIQEVNAASGANVAGTISTRGWYLQVVPSSPTVRQARGPKQVNFWYADGQSVQKISLSSVELQ